MDCISGHQKLTLSIRFKDYIKYGFPVTLYPLTPTQLATI